MITPENIENAFTYHRPKGGQPSRYEAIRAAGREFAELIYNAVPDSPERDTAIDRLRETVMWSNAGIACNE